MLPLHHHRATSAAVSLSDPFVRTVRCLTTTIVGRRKSFPRKIIYLNTPAFLPNKTSHNTCYWVYLDSFYGFQGQPLIFRSFQWDQLVVHVHAHPHTSFWSSGKILAPGARGPGFHSWLSPISIVSKQREPNLSCTPGFLVVNEK